LKPGEKIDMPVVFFIDPDLDDEEILNKLKTITLSYTMFREDDEETPVAAVKDSINRKTFN
jgi:cytochrome c oxidase assembly protein subunit 11